MIEVPSICELKWLFGIRRSEKFYYTGAGKRELERMYREANHEEHARWSNTLELKRTQLELPLPEG